MCALLPFCFFFKQKTAYEMRISDWSSDVCSSDLFFLAIERTFDLRPRSNLPWTTFGEVRDHVVAHVAAYSGGGTTCATQMTFYRLRRALGLGRHVGPDAPDRKSTRLNSSH